MPNYRISFRCLNPNCGGERLEEHLIEVTQDSQIKEIELVPSRDVSGNVYYAMEYGDVSTDFGRVGEYRCMECGMTICNSQNEDITSEGELFQWLKEHGMLETIE